LGGFHFIVAVFDLGVYKVRININLTFLYYYLADRKSKEKLFDVSMDVEYSEN